MVRLFAPAATCLLACGVAAADEAGEGVGSAEDSDVLQVGDEVNWIVTTEVDEIRWWALAEPGERKLCASSMGSTTDTLLVVQARFGTGGEWSEVARNDDWVGVASQLDFLPEPGREYRLGLLARRPGQVRLVLDETVPAFLPWAEIEPPVNNRRGQAQEIEGGLPQEVFGNLAGAESDSGAIGGATVWYRWQPPDDWSGDERLRVEVTSDEPLRLAAFEGESSDPLALSQPGSSSLLLDVGDFDDSGDLVLAVGHSSGESDDAFRLSLALLEPFANETWRTPRVLEGDLPLATEQDITGATRDDPESTIERGGGGVWYAYTPMADGRLRVSTLGSRFDTEIGVYVLREGEPDLLARNDDGPNGDTSSQVDLEVTAGEQLLIGVVGFRGEQGHVRLVIGRP